MKTGPGADKFRAMAEAWKDLADGLAEVGQRVSQLLTAQGAFGWACKGEVEKTREVLGDLPDGMLHKVAAAGIVITSIADELLAERKATETPPSQP